MGRQSSRRRLGRAAAVVGVAAAALVFVWFFVSSLGERRPDEPDAYVSTVPPGYTDLGAFEGGRSASAEAILAAAGGSGRLAARYRDGAADVTILADLGGNLIREIRRAPRGTATETVWEGTAHRRLESAAAGEGFEPEGTSAGIGKNLYH